MRTIGAWLLAAVTILFSVIIALQVGESHLPEEILDIRSYPGWVDVAAGIAVGVAAVLVAVTAGAAGDTSNVQLRDGRELPKAGIAARVAARLVDLLVVTPGIFIVLRDIYRAMDASLHCFLRPYCEPAEPPPLLTGAAIVALALVVLYEPVLVARWGRTAGKWAAGIKVVSTAEDARPSVARSFARVALPAAAGLATLGAGWLVMQTVLWVSAMANRDRRGWHDKLAATVVVKAKRRPARSNPRGGNGTVTGGTGDDTLHGGTGADTFEGNTQNDTLWGGPGDDTLDGQGHSDELHGGTGDDTLRGGAADDRVYGGAGDDTLDGGNGSDHLDGGNGTDACIRGDTTTGCETEGRRP